MKKKRLKKFLIAFSLSLVTIVSILIIALLIFASTCKINEQKLKVAEADISIYDDKSNIISSNKSYTKLSEIPDKLQQAFIATEDKRFYSHKGLDYVRIMGAIVHDIKTKSLDQGASTISCQLIKNTHLSNEKTFNRKLKEAILSKKLEKEYSKDEILEMYLNVIYFGTGIYGVSNASYVFFGKQPNELTLSECASLASIVVNPKNYSPILNIENNNKRKNTVLSLMHEQGYISDEEYNEEKIIKVVANTPSNAKFTDYTQIALWEASEILGISQLDIKRNGYSIYTYLDEEKQTKCQGSIEEAQVSTSLMVADPNHFSITAYSSNHGYSPFTMKRNAGSIIKPFVYAGAFENNLLFPISPIDDSPTEFGDYKPKNFANNYRDTISIREALSHSSNVCAVKVLQTLGFNRARQTLSSFGFKTNSKDENYALALGALSEGVTISEIVQSYSVFANGGNFANLSTIKMIKDKNGKVVYERNVTSNKIISSDTVSMINDCLMNCTKEGTAKKLSRYGGLCAKTGTFEVGDKNSDAWCVAYDSENVYCSWLGNLSMKKEDMIENKGSFGINHLVKIIDNDINPAPVEKIKQGLDMLVLKRTGQIKLASDNTPERYIIYDFAPKHCEISTLFTSPTVDAKISLIGEDINIKINAHRECSYIIYNRKSPFPEEIGYVQGNDNEITISSKAYNGFNEIVIIPTVHGKNEIDGIEFRESVYY